MPDTWPSLLLCSRQFEATLDVLSSFIVIWRYSNAAAVHSAHREYMWVQNKPPVWPPHPLLLLRVRLFVLAERAWSSGSSSFSPPSASWGKLPITWLSGCRQKWCGTRCTDTHMPRIVAYATSIYSFLLLWRWAFVTCLLHFVSTNTQACTHAR